MKTRYLAFVALLVPLLLPGNAASAPLDLTLFNPVSGAPLAKGDGVWGITSCVVAPTHLSTLACAAPAPAYAVPAAPYTTVVVIDDAAMNAGGFRVPYVGTITASSGGGATPLMLTISPAANFPTQGVFHVANLDVVSSGATGGYAFGQTQTLTCSGCSAGDVPATGTPGVMAAVSITVLTGGSGGTTPCTGGLVSVNQVALAGNTGTPLLSHFGGTISSGHLMSPVIASSGSIIANTSTTFSSGGYTETLVGCGFTTSPTVRIKYIVTSERITFGSGIYLSTPPCAVTRGATTMSSDPGTGLVLSCLLQGETFRGTAAYGTDNTAALQDALGTTTSPAAGTMNAAAAVGRPICLYLPAGNYLTKPLNQYATASPSATMNVAQGYGCWLGDANFHTNIFVIPNKAGDVSAFLSDGQNNSLPILVTTPFWNNITSTTTGTANQAGTNVRNMTIIGDCLSTMQQNAISFYGRTSFAHIADIDVMFMNGRGIYAGGPDTSSQGVGDFNESLIQNARF